jgi:hypothetical protein
VQARVRARTHPVATLRDGRLEIEDTVVDLDPFIWRDGQARGIYARGAAPSGLTNILAGGHMLPCLSVG